MDIEIVKSPLDERSYSHNILPNGLQLLIISDPTTKESAASMEIKVGMLDDPIDA
jgi:secreted Zn-dependent insulinase-like peptidase